MTRIIAGAIGSLQLKTAAKATRPTSDRVKESLFAKLDAMGAIADSVVLDLFAGTGALGLESASRGAKEVFFVEKDWRAFELLRANVQAAESSFRKQGLHCNLAALNVEARNFLKFAAGKFDLVFVDPPYELDVEVLEGVLLGLVPSLSGAALVIVERSSKEKKLVIPGLHVFFSKSYGDTSLQFMTT